MQWKVLKRVSLQPHHLSPGRTTHTLVDASGARPFPPFTSLEIARYPEDSGYYLLHICEGGPGTDTWHETLEHAVKQAEWEFDVKREEWIDVGVNEE